MSNWISGLPTEVGNYWLWSYRYGKGAIGRENDKEMTLVKVFNISNGIMVVGEGQTVWKSEVEEPQYIPAVIPEPPKGE